MLSLLSGAGFKHWGDLLKLIQIFPIEKCRVLRVLPSDQDGPEPMQVRISMPPNFRGCTLGMPRIWTVPKGDTDTFRMLGCCQEHLGSTAVGISLFLLLGQPMAMGLCFLEWASWARDADRKLHLLHTAGMNTCVCLPESSSPNTQWQYLAKCVFSGDLNHFYQAGSGDTEAQRS